MAGIFLNGVEFFPSDAQKTTEKIGAVHIAANGNRTWIQRVDAGSNPIHKRQWTIPWKDVPEAVRAAVEAIFLLATTFPYVDQHGTSYTVQCEADGYNESVTTIAPDGTLYYDVELTVYQA